MEDEVLLQINGAVAEVVLNRPKKLNAVTPAMSDLLESISRQVDRDPNVRVVLLRGSGDRAFCSGSDIGTLADYESAWRFRTRTEYATAIRNIRKPVVAALHGWVLGGGAELALSADIRFMARGAKLGFPEVTRGWVGGGGASQLLPRLVGYGQAMRLLLSGDPIDAEEAHRLGLIETLTNEETLLEQTRAFCSKLAGYSPVALEAVKASVRMAMMSALPAGLIYENEMNTLCFSAGDHREGINAFVEKRVADFKR